MTRPAAASDQPSADDPASSVAATPFVRYGVKTKVMITALNDAEPQSHRAQLKTPRRELDGDLGYARMTSLY
ncbi:hypothetical protein NCCP602_02010 [Brevibacterium metallidurans]|uniref:Uncharacterized protein n=1 Tax=Brevibacterium metallidurans TaxID=1482676 RepID=A0ABP3C3N5_9MICO